MKKFLLKLWKDEEGASAIEYALIAAMVAVALVAFVGPVRDAITGIFNDILNALTGANGNGD
ncbi:Flp family type IVb pilin [Alkalilimnicola ehrlichii MLHE-1]|uniref:Flp/Fap pilin component n=1 Tax=Alkalilimnicola ehrlichii (strain ATCC BAA-1101 / DSM 17681 / MLHE-1) TaxID=187272 RepID=Q0A6N1_ALKEH|nr:Flp family type IVb pilin [Alkalilimnicola ehrlichii]ABI57506.1 Flp/Fap pilin component [Alkalilimnicola ehrlichii MLHE-1]